MRQLVVVYLRWLRPLTPPAATSELWITRALILLDEITAKHESPSLTY